MNYEKIKLDQYIKNPTLYSSLPYYKMKTFNYPEGMLILNDYEFDESLLNNYEDNPYFKLMHDLERIDTYNISNRYAFKNCSVEDFSKHINSCYEYEGISIDELESYKLKKVYNANLWICLYDNQNDKIVATGIAEFDSEAKEGILDWIQVSEEYRGIGMGKIIVNELLKRLKKLALYVTVSGRVNNKTKPEYLYKSCGFKNEIIWHVLTKKI